MVDKKELSIGNYIRVGILPSRILALRRASLETDGANVYYKDVKPIPLNPGVLLKCGFTSNTYIGGSTYYELEFPDEYGFKLEYRIERRAKEWTEFRIIGNGGYDDAGERFITNTCKYLHQLQNLYQSMCGKELIIETL